MLDLLLMMIGQVLLNVLTSTRSQTYSSQPNDLKCLIGDKVTGYVHSAEFRYDQVHHLGSNIFMQIKKKLLMKLTALKSI